MGLVYSVRVVSLLWPYLGGRARTADAVARTERAVLRQNIFDMTAGCYSGQQSCQTRSLWSLYSCNSWVFPSWPFRLGTLGKTIF